MQKCILVLSFILHFFIGFSQNLIIAQYRVADGKTHRIKVGDKVLLSFEQ